MKRLGKKGIGFADLPHVALWFMLAGIFFAVALVILTNFQSAGGTVDQNSAANSAVTKVRTALTEIPNNWLLLIAVIVAAAVIISVVMGFMGNREQHS